MKEFVKQKKRNKIRDNNMTVKGRYYFGAFVIPVFILILVLLARGILFNGENSILFSDLSNIYADLLLGYRNALLEGVNPLYSFNFGMGINFLLYIASNLSSVLNVTLLLVPSQYFQEGILVLQLLRIGLSGLTFYIFLEYRFRKSDVSLIVFSSAYALSAYSICFLQHIMWYDSIVLLPLVIIYTDRLLKTEKLISGKFIAILVLLFWSNFYIGYMISVFIICYTFREILTRKSSTKKNFKCLGRVALNGVLSAGVSAIFLLPVALSMLEVGEVAHFDIKFRYKISEIINQFFLGQFDTYRPGGRPLLYCGILTFLLILLYAGCTRISKRKRIIDVSLLLFLILSLQFNPLYYIWHMLDNPDWFEGRFSFIIIFYIIELGFEAFLNIDHIKIKRLILSMSLVGCIFFVCLKLYGDVEYLIIIANLAFLILYTAILFALIKHKNFNGYRIGVVLLACVELFVNANILTVKMFQEEGNEDATLFRKYVEQNEEIIDYLSQDTSFYRIEKDYYRRENDWLAVGGRGISEFGSFYNKPLNHMLRQLGFTSTSKIVRYEGGTVVTDSLLGIKYLCSLWGLFPFYDRVDIIEDKLIYVNPYALTIGTLVDDQLWKVDVDGYKNPFELQNVIVQSMFDIKNELFFSAKDYDEILTNVDKTILEDGYVSYEKNDVNREGVVEYRINKKENSLLYGYVKNTLGDLDIYINNIPISGFMGQTYKILNLENSPIISEEIVLKLILNSPEVIVDPDILYRLDTDEFKKNWVNTRGSIKYDVYSSGDISLQVSSNNDSNTLLLSIPYDKGWKVTVNGEKRAVKPILNGLSAIKVDAGTSVVELRFIPYGLAIGGCISICCLILVFAIGIMQKKRY